jgi:hypothetical protein
MIVLGAMLFHSLPSYIYQADTEYQHSYFSYPVAQAKGDCNEGAARETITNFEENDATSCP